MLNRLRIQIQTNEKIFEIFYILNKVEISDMQFQYFIWALVSRFAVFEFILL